MITASLVPRYKPVKLSSSYQLGFRNFRQDTCGCITCRPRILKFIVADLTFLMCSLFTQDQYFTTICISVSNSSSATSPYVRWTFESYRPTASTRFVQICFWRQNVSLCRIFCFKMLFGFYSWLFSLHWLVFMLLWVRHCNAAWAFILCKTESLFARKLSICGIFSDWKPRKFIEPSIHTYRHWVCAPQY